MTEYGVTDEGFVKKVYSTIIAEKEAAARSYFGEDVDLTETSPLKKFLEVQALEEVRLWEMAESLYYSAFVEFASGDNLDKVVALLGLERNPATRATGIVRFTGTSGVKVDEDVIVSTDEGVQFTTTEEKTISDSYVDVAVQAVLVGSTGNVSANTITNLDTYISGITSVTNPNPTTGGADVETDAALRLRAADILQSLGKGTVAAIRAAVLDVDGVTGCAVEEDFDFHSVGVWVSGTPYPNQEITDAIEAVRPAGILVTWWAAEDITIYVDTTVALLEPYPSDIVDKVKTAIENYIDALALGDDVVYNAVLDEIMDADTSIYDVTMLKVDTVSPPEGKVNIPIGDHEKAIIDPANITVYTVPA